MKKSALIALVVILVVAAVGGGLWAVMRYVLPTETDPAAIVPPGARFFMELDATRMSEADLAVADEYAAFTRKIIGGEFELPPMKDLACRGALIVYGSAKLQGMVPGLVIVFETPKPEAFSAFEEKILKALESSGPEEREFQGWTVIEAKQRMPIGAEVYLGLARKGTLRIFATGKPLLEECINLAEAGKIEGTLAADAAFLAAFEGLPFAAPDQGVVARIKGLVLKPVRANQRVYLDLKGIGDDLHPLLSMAGGETYREIKEKFLVHLGSFAATGGPENGGLRSVSALRLSSSPAWMAELAEARLAWPGREPEGAQLSFAIALPASFTEMFSLIVSKTGETRATAAIGQAHGVMGSLNGALAMYFADHEGEYPIAETPTPISGIGIVPEYMAEAPMTAWKEPFLYQGDGATYVISTMIDGESVTWYSSASGRVESAQNAKELIQAASEAEMEQMKILLAGVREIGFAMMPGERRGLEALMGPRFSLKADDGHVLAIRFHDAAMAAAAESSVATLLPNNEAPLQVREDWIMIGAPKIVEALRAGSEPTAASGFLQSRSTFDLATVVPEERVADLPAAHQWTSTGNGTIDGQTILIESMGAPDPMPAIFGALGALIHADKFDFPTPGRRPRSPRPVRPQEPESESNAPTTE